MANIASAAKRARQAAKNRLHNIPMRSRARTYVKQLHLKIKAGDHEDAMKFFSQTMKVLDQMVSKGLYQKNKVARYKSNLNRKIKALKVA